MTIEIENPFQGFTVGWTWAEHVANRYQGGTDYVFYPSDGNIVAAADGKIGLQSGGNGFTPGPAIILNLGDGRSVNYREVASVLVVSGQTVKRGDPVGVANKASKWPHIDATVNGVRVPFEPLVNIGTTPAGGHSIGEENMAVKIWHYQPLDSYIVIDHLNMTYRIIPKGSIEDQGLHNDVAAGFARTDEITDPAWGQNFGNGQFLPITKPYVPSASGVTIAQIHTELQSLATTADIPTTEQLGQGLTSAVSLSNAHTDTKFATLTLHT